MPRTHRPYPPEFRAEAVRLARSGAKSIPALAADEGRGQPGELPTDEREERRRLRREVKVLQQERETSRKAATCFAKGAL